jgi:sugar O-acyltransferase (sialic acid O-acetyltransferase NeuD family)
MKMGKKKLILIGGGGHCKSCIDVIESAGAFEIAGILDVKEKVGGNIAGYSIIGTDEELDRFAAEDYYFLITIGQIKSADIRRKIFEQLIAAGKKLATVISAHARVSKYSSVGAGTIVMHGASINAAASVGENCIINTNANVEHDCRIGDHIHVSTNAVLNGECKIGNGSFVGSNSVLVNGITIGENIIIGAGTVVNKSLNNPGIYTGNPCRKIN